MINIEHDFPFHKLEDWIIQLKKDLTEDQLYQLEKWDDFQELKKNAVLNAENTKFDTIKKGEFPFTRGYGNTDYNYFNRQTIDVSREKEANEEALDCLMNGCSSLEFHLQNLQSFDPEILFKSIDFRFISCFAVVQNQMQFDILLKYFKGNFPDYFFLSYDHFQFKDNILFQELTSVMKRKQFKTLIIAGHEIQDKGANASQELAFCLSVGKDYLEQLINYGLTIDQSLACIHFSFGIGSDYFVEIAKIRAFRKLWSLIVEKYEPKHSCSYVTYISAKIGLSNKSVNDPHNNLLRQTAETLSALHANVDGINITPFEKLTEHSNQKFSRKMAINIPLILIEESKINANYDVLGGSFTLESLTEQLCKNTWDLFRQIERQGGIEIDEAQNFLKGLILEKKRLLKSQIETGQRIYVGINKYQTKDKLTEISFSKFPNYLGLPFFNIEQ
jgi:methylmalonyl-CoA mutase